jgi:hypothetical protein
VRSALSEGPRHSRRERPICRRRVRLAGAIASADRPRPRFWLCVTRGRLAGDEERGRLAGVGAPTHPLAGDPGGCRARPGLRRGVFRSAADRRRSCWPPLGHRLPRPRLAGHGWRPHRRARATRRHALRHDGGVLHRLLREPRSAVLAVHDSLPGDIGRRRRAGQIAVVSVLGGRGVRSAGDRDLHGSGLLGVSRQAAPRVWSIAATREKDGEQT